MDVLIARSATFPWLHIGSVFLAASSYAATAFSAQECRADAEAVERVRAVAVGIIEADNERAIERVLAFYAEDAVWMPPGEDALVGPAAFRPRYEGLFANFNPEIELRIDEACVSGSMAFVRGHNGGRLVSRTSDEVRALNDSFLMLLRRESDGEWRISHLIWHPENANQ